MHKLFSCTLLLFLTINAFSQTNSFWNTNSTVNIITKDSARNRVYIGGNFTKVYPYYPNGAILDSDSGDADLTNPHPNGQVFTAIPDRRGGWYIGGSFSKIGDSTRNNIAQLDSLGNVTLWAPSIDSVVYALHLRNNKLYVGGEFNSVNNVPRSKIAELDLNSGGLSQFSSPVLDSAVLSISVKDSTLYIGGKFTAIGGVSRMRFAALNLLNNNLTTINIPSSTPVSAMLFIDTNLYLSGTFNTVYGSTFPFNHTLRINQSGKIDSIWYSRFVGEVFCLTSSGNLLYGGGENAVLFRVDVSKPVSNFSRTKFFQLIGSSIDAMDVKDSTVFIGGEFYTQNGPQRAMLASIDTSLTTVSTWNPEVDQQVTALAISSSRVYVGGKFSSVSSESRTAIAAFDLNTKNLLSWNPKVDNSVGAIAVYDSLVYIGGLFDSIGGISRSKLACINSNTALPTSWNPSANIGVYALKLSANTLYVGGGFTSIAGQIRNRLAAFNLTNGTLDTLNIDVNGDVRTIDIDGTNLYFGGAFTQVNSTVRDRLASVNLASQNLNNWRPQANQTVFVLKVSNSSVFLGGHFTNVGGRARNKLAEVDKFVGRASNWDPNVTSPTSPFGFISDIQINGNTVLIGGGFTMVGSTARSNLAAIDINSGAALNWSPSITGLNYFSTSNFNFVPSIRTMLLLDSNIVVGGNFLRIGNKTEKSFGSLLLPPPLISTGLNSHQKDFSFNQHLYPNPSSGLVNIGGLEFTKRIEVYSISGQLILTKRTPYSTGIVDLNSLINGLYIVRIVTPTNSFVEKLIIEK